MSRRSVAPVAVLALALLFPRPVAAHCDTLGGPVIADARTALETRDVTPVLKWVKPHDEGEIREQFGKALKVRAQGREAQELADKYFFETLVRVHRRGEGQPYTGLKPADAVEPIIAHTDQALAGGKADELAAMLQRHLAEGIGERFARVLQAKKHATESVAAGREYVEAYVELTHYIESLHAAVLGHAGTQHAPATQHAHTEAPEAQRHRGNSGAPETQQERLPVT